jgi:multiple sugar transport system substrate-binding protein
MRKNIKEFSLLLGIIIMTALFISCKGDRPQKGSRENSSPASGTKLNMLVLSGGYKPAIENSVANFVANTGIQVELVGLEDNALREKTLIELKSGSGQFDVVSVDGPPWIVEIHDGLEPLQSYIERDSIDINKFVPTYLEMSRWPSIYTVHPADYKFGDGEILALPVRVGVHILHYRKDLFEINNLQPPTNMRELRQAAEILTGGKTQDGENVYGIILQGEQSIWLTIQFLDFLWSFGGELLTEDMSKSALNSPAAKAAANFVVGLYQDGLSPPGTPTYNMDNAVSALQQGIGAMYVEYSPRALVLDNPNTSKTAGKWAWRPIPAVNGDIGVGCITGWSMGINKYSKNKDAAWELIKYLTSEEIQTKMAIENANGPVITSVFYNEEYQAANPAALAVVEAAAKGKVRPGVNQSALIEDIIATEMNAALLKAQTADEAMDKAHQRINDVLADN